MFVSILVQLLAVTMLALAMFKHFKHVFKRVIKPSHSRLLRWLGWLLIGLSYYLAILALAAPMATVYWLSFLPLSILFIAIMAN